MSDAANEKDIANSLDILARLSEEPELCLAPDSPYEEIARAASLLTRRIKSARKKESRQRDREVVEQAGIRQKRTDKTYGKYLTDGDDDFAREEKVDLDRQRRCYVCKQPYATLHSFYDAMCKPCGDLNFAKRNQTADLRGRQALVTGGRIKIGFQIALKLLRAGADVAVTSRFPNDTAFRYSQEEDFEAWATRLRIYSADFRYLPAVHQLCEDIVGQHESLDILINNAAQTVRRPPEYYRHLLDKERELSTKLPEPALKSIVDSAMTNIEAHDLTTNSERDNSVHIAALMSQAKLLTDDGQHLAESFPLELYDRDGQQIDHRDGNSWVMRLANVPIPELLEVHAVNSLANFILIQRLEPLLLTASASDRYIVNVSAVEGQMNIREKTGMHVHTNMAKAGLNMITRTCSDHYAQRGIYMTNVDTGWITNEFPFAKTESMQSGGFQPPLDEIDGAARVCDPVFVGANDQQYLYGKFFKDYRETKW